MSSGSREKKAPSEACAQVTQLGRDQPALVAGVTGSSSSSSSACPSNSSSSPGREMGGKKGGHLHSTDDKVHQLLMKMYKEMSVLKRQRAALMDRGTVPLTECEKAAMQYETTPTEVLESILSSHRRKMADQITMELDFVQGLGRSVVGNLGEYSTRPKKEEEEEQEQEQEQESGKQGGATREKLSQRPLPPPPPPPPRPASVGSDQAPTRFFRRRAFVNAEEEFEDGRQQRPGLTDPDVIASAERRNMGKWCTAALIAMAEGAENDTRVKQAGQPFFQQMKAGKWDKESAQERGEERAEERERGRGEEDEGSADTADDGSGEEPCCRFCFGTASEGPNGAPCKLIRPCHCKGSVAYIHGEVRTVFFFFLTPAL